MLAVLSSLVWAACLACGEGSPALTGGYLRRVVPGPDGAVHEQVEPYVPQAGDLVLFDDHNPVWLFLYHMAGTDMPDHSGIVVAMPDGRPVLLEAGPDDGKLCGLYVRLLEAVPRLHQFEGTIYIRRLKQPLTPEQSARLTAFAFQQEGKRYALVRMLLQGTPFRCRQGLRAKLFARTSLDRRSWICAELVVAAGTVAGLFDPKVHHANAIYPRDMLYDDVYDLSPTWYPAGLWMPAPQPDTANPH